MAGDSASVLTMRFNEGCPLEIERACFGIVIFKVRRSQRLVPALKDPLQRESLAGVSSDDQRRGKLWELVDQLVPKMA